MNTPPSLHHIFTLPEAATLWEVPYRTLHSRTVTLENKIQYNQRFTKDKDFRTTNRAILITYEAMTRILGKEKHPIPESENYLSLDEVLTVDELSTLINRTPANIVSVDIQGGYGKFAPRFRPEEWRKSGSTYLLSKHVIKRIYNHHIYDIELGKFKETINHLTEPKKPSNMFSLVFTPENTEIETIIETLSVQNNVNKVTIIRSLIQEMQENPPTTFEIIPLKNTKTTPLCISIKNQTHQQITDLTSSYSTSINKLISNLVLQNENFKNIKYDKIATNNIAKPPSEKINFKFIIKNKQIEIALKDMAKQLNSKKKIIIQDVITDFLTTTPPPNFKILSLEDSQFTSRYPINLSLDIEIHNSLENLANTHSTNINNLIANLLLQNTSLKS